MDALQAAILSHRLKLLPKTIQKRRENAKIYQDLLDRDYVFPEREFDDLFRDYDRKEFFTETWDEETGQYVGGYYPERVEYLLIKE